MISCDPFQQPYGELLLDPFYGQENKVTLIISGRGWNPGVRLQPALFPIL